MKTFSTKYNEQKTTFFAPSESSYSAKKSHFLLTKCHGQEIQQQSYRFGTSDVQAFCVEIKIEIIFLRYKEDNIIPFFLFYCALLQSVKKKSQLH
jgi:hypothetical protein